MVPVTLVEGGDPSLVSQAATKVIDELVGDEDRNMAVEDHGGDDTDIAAIADACATPPFLTGCRVVVVRDVGRFNTEEVQPLLGYLKAPLPATALVLVAGGGQTAPKLVAAVKAEGRVVTTSVDTRKASSWAHERIAEAGLALEPPAEQALVAHLGEDVSRLVAILEVLRAVYGEGARLGQEDIEPYVGEAGSVTPWAFTDAVDSGDAALAIDLLHRLLEGGGRHPLVVLAILHRHVQSLMRVDGPHVRTEAQAAEAMGIATGRSTYPAKKALRSARQWGSAGISEAIGMIADAEVDLKGASAWPEAAVLEVLVARLCRTARSGSARSPRQPAAALAAEPARRATAGRARS